MKMISTIHGDMDEAALERRAGVDEKPSDSMPNIHERVEWVEYWLDGVVVHRSAHIILTNTAPVGADIGSISHV